MRLPFLAPALTIALSACSGVVPSTVARLSLLDPLTADPAGFAVALETSDGLDLIAGTTVLIFEAIHSPSGEVLREELVLNEDRSEDGRVIYVIAPDGVERLRVLQTELLGWKDTSDGENSLSLGVTTEGCRVVGVVVPDDPRVSIFLQLSAETPMRPLVRNGPLNSMFDVEELAELPQCSA